MTLKSLLRHPQCVSSVSELVEGRFQEVIDDTMPGLVKEELVFCSVNCITSLEEEKNNANDVALVRGTTVSIPKHTRSIINKYANARPMYGHKKNLKIWVFGFCT